MLLLSASVASQSQFFNQEQLKEDFGIFRGALEEAHPGLYWYRSKEEMDSTFNRVFESLDHEMTEHAFYKAIVPVVSKIGCGHTWAAATVKLQKKLWNEGKVLPLSLKFIQDKAYCFRINSSQQTLIQPGNEILSINNFPIDSLINISYSLHFGDGLINTGKLRILEREFSNYYTLFIDQPDLYEIEFIDKSGNRKIDQIRALTYEEIHRVSPERKASEVKPNIELQFPESPKTAILTIKEFDDWKEGKRKKKFEAVLKQCFESIYSAETDNLIIDLRNNTGGNEEYGLNLYSYLINKPFIGYKQIDFKTTSFSFRKYTTTPRIEYFAIKTVLKHEKVNDSTYLLKNDKATKEFNPSFPQFAGNLYILINGSSFSTTSDFTALVHSNKIATFIGEETGGSYVGNSSDYELQLVLPNTKIRVGIPISRYWTNVSPTDEQGRGTMPDYPLSPSIQDLLDGVDTEMNFTFNLIKQISDQ